MAKTKPKKAEPKMVPCVDVKTGHVKDEHPSSLMIPIPSGKADAVKALPRPRRMSLASAVRMAPDAKHADIWNAHLKAFTPKED